MVDLSGNSPYQHSFPNIVFIVPAIIVFGLIVSCRLSVNELRANLCLRRNMEKIVETVGGAADSIKDELDETRENVLNRLPSAEQFKMFIDKLQSMTDEEKEELKQNLIERAANEENLRKLYQNKHVVESSLLDIVIVLGFYGMVLVVVAVFGFFGYKLYKSIVQKDMKREKKSKKELKASKKTQSPPASPRTKKEH